MALIDYSRLHPSGGTGWSYVTPTSPDPVIGTPAKKKRPSQFFGALTGAATPSYTSGVYPPVSQAVRSFGNSGVVAASAFKSATPPTTRAPNTGQPSGLSVFLDPLIAAQGEAAPLTGIKTKIGDTGYVLSQNGQFYDQNYNPTGVFVTGDGRLTDQTGSADYGTWDMHGNLNFSNGYSSQYYHPDMLFYDGYSFKINPDGSVYDNTNNRVLPGYSVDGNNILYNSEVVGTADDYGRITPTAAPTTPTTPEPVTPVVPTGGAGTPPAATTATPPPATSSTSEGMFDLKAGVPNMTYPQFQQQYGATPPLDQTATASSVAAEVQAMLAERPTYNDSRDATQQSLDLAAQALTDLNDNSFDPTAYREAARGRISRGARDIAQQSLSAIANRGQVNSTIGADFVSGNVNRYVADAFTDLESAIMDAEFKDKTNRTNMYSTISNTYGNAAKLYGDIDRNIAADRINAINTSTGVMKDLQAISTTQNEDQRGWIELYDRMLNSASQRGINAGIFQANYTAPIGAGGISSLPDVTVEADGKTYTLGGDKQFYLDGNPTGVFVTASDNRLTDASGMADYGSWTNSGKIVYPNGNLFGTWRQG